MNYFLGALSSLFVLSILITLSSFSSSLFHRCVRLSFVPTFLSPLLISFAFHRSLLSFSSSVHFFLFLYSRCFFLFFLSFFSFASSLFFLSPILFCFLLLRLFSSFAFYSLHSRALSLPLFSPPSSILPLYFLLSLFPLHLCFLLPLLFSYSPSSTFSPSFPSFIFFSSSFHYHQSKIGLCGWKEGRAVNRFTIWVFTPER